MLTVTDLWLPILLSAVFVFVVSSIIHMALPIHKGDFRKLPGEDRILEAIRSQNVPRGAYMFPCAESMKDMGSPEMIEKCKRGPVGYVNIMPSGAPGLGKNLVQWFVYSLIIGVFVAYAAGLVLARGAEAMEVFRFAASVGILAYATYEIPASIWKGQRWSTTFKFVFDGVVYGLVTGGTFAWLWPAAVAAA